MKFFCWGRVKVIYYINVNDIWHSIHPINKYSLNFPFSKIFLTVWYGSHFYIKLDWILLPFFLSCKRFLREMHYKLYKRIQRTLTKLNIGLSYQKTTRKLFLPKRTSISGWLTYHIVTKYSRQLQQSVSIHTVPWHWKLVMVMSVNGLMTLFSCLPPRLLIQSLLSSSLRTRSGAAAILRFPATCDSHETSAVLVLLAWKCCCNPCRWLMAPRKSLLLPMVGNASVRDWEMSGLRRRFVIVVFVAAILNDLTSVTTAVSEGGDLSILKRQRV